MLLKQKILLPWACWVTITGSEWRLCSQIVLGAVPSFYNLTPFIHFLLLLFFNYFLLFLIIFITDVPFFLLLAPSTLCCPLPRPSLLHSFSLPAWLSLRRLNGWHLFQTKAIGKKERELNN